MRSASHALVGLLAVVGLVVVVPAPARAGPAPACPVTIADQPLSVAAPFSGTPRPRADSEGTIVATSLLCAYGEGVQPAATVTVTWTAGRTDAGCHDVSVAVAPSLDPAPFARGAADLAAPLGPTCAAPATGVPLPALIAGAVGAMAMVLLRARRRRRPADREIPAAGPDEPRSAPAASPSA